MSISLITNFKINSDKPIDTRLVATGPDGLNNMEYKYAGLTVYRTDTQLQYVWDGSTWEISSNGIYGGSGSLIGDTHIDGGFIGTNSTDETYKFILSASSSNEVFNYVSNFSRNSIGDVRYRNSFLIGTFSGPYIEFNPGDDPLLPTFRGGLAIGTGLIDTYERFKIDSNGVIRFKPTPSLTASLNISNSSESVNFGYNWVGVKDYQSIGSSFIRFTNQVLSINHIATNSNSFTHSVIFYNTDHEFTMDVNGVVRTMGVVLGPYDTFMSVANQGIGIGITKGLEEFSIFNNNNTRSFVISDKSILIGSSDYTIQTDLGSTFSVLGNFQTKNKTNLWDNSFNVDSNGPTSQSDNYWHRLPLVGDSYNDSSETGGVRVFINTTETSQDTQFMFITNGYTSKDAISSWTSTKKPYDRIFYFHNESGGYHITHELTWYLSNDDGVNWKKIGISETGNLDNYNNESGATSSYAMRYYSNSAIVPANMDFKVKFRFRNDFTPDFAFGTVSAPSVIFSVLRSGVWRTEYSNELISNV